MRDIPVSMTVAWSYFSNTRRCVYRAVSRLGANQTTNLLPIVLTLLLPCLPVAAQTAFAVLADDELPLYRQVVTGIAVEAKGTVYDYHLNGDQGRGDELMKEILKKPPRLIFTIGPKSLAAATRAAPDIPIIYTMVPRSDEVKIGPTQAAGVRLEVSYENRLRALQHVLPAVKKVGVVYTAEKSAEMIVKVGEIGKRLGIQIVGVVAKDASSVEAALKEKAEVQAILMVADPSVLHIDGFRSLMAFSSREKVPVFSLDGQFVDQGALLAFQLNAGEIGRQAGRMGNDIIAQKMTLSATGLRDPAGLDLAVNLGVAEKMGLQPGFATKIMGIAGQNGWGLRVYGAGPATP
jgi:ABC-type uncharacterized transport system substrate-binding protein